mmetsp:Transcript_22686/g.36551  ORF Transcript_22686/g.36551 Transcript_22686/m.36551 type:complete len:151 (-) Transcript_22686:200-652(-)
MMHGVPLFRSCTIWATLVLAMIGRASATTTTTRIKFPTRALKASNQLMRSKFGCSGEWQTKMPRSVLILASKKDQPKIDLKAIQERMEREAPGFIANEQPPQRVRREAAMNESVISGVRAGIVVIVCCIMYALFLANGDLKLPSWIQDLS